MPSLLMYDMHHSMLLLYEIDALIIDVVNIAGASQFGRQSRFVDAGAAAPQCLDVFSGAIWLAD
eukprot:COSAG02_NODE_797_length_17106_cov_4.363615_6_plen_64_part_00